MDCSYGFKEAYKDNKAILAIQANDLNNERDILNDTIAGALTKLSMQSNRIYLASWRKKQDLQGLKRAGIMNVKTCLHPLTAGKRFLFVVKSISAYP
jgi:hypothetical protein